MNDQYFIKHPALPFAEFRHSLNSGQHYKTHMHRTFSIGAIDQGEVIFEVEAKKAHLRPGSLALINPETLHSCNPTEYRKRSYYVLYLDVNWCLQLQQSLWRLEAFCPVKTILLHDNAIYQQYINAMQTLMSAGELLAKEQILVALVEIIFLQACEPAAAKNEPSAQIEQLKRRLSMDLDRDITMRQLALKLRANPYTLLRQFKTDTGITPHAYRLNCKIERAKKLLQKGFDLVRVALKCGFFDQSHFHRQFKAITTVTPKEYQVNFKQ